MEDSLAEISVQCIGGLRASVLVSGEGTVGELRKAILVALGRFEIFPLIDDHLMLGECYVGAVCIIFSVALQLPVHHAGAHFRTRVSGTR